MRGSHYVYVYFRLDGDPCYVGKGKGNRFREHLYFTDNQHFQRIIDNAKALGRELPVVILHEGLTDEVAKQYEIALIAAIGRDANGGPLCNLTDGGDGTAGYIPSRETVARQQASRAGYRHSEETKARLRASNVGKKRSAETREKVRLSKIGNQFQKGRRSPESCERMRQRRLGTTLTQEHRENIRKGMQRYMENRARVSE